MCALTPTMFPNKQQEWYSASTMEYSWLQSHHQVDSFLPTLQYDFPSFLYPNNLSAQSDDFKNYNLDHQMSFSHSNGTNSNSNTNTNNDQEEDQGTAVLEKKLNHNASERDRRRKLNGLYTSLRDLLPPSGEKRKLSIPVTIARVVTYIPEQKQELQRLSRKKEELLKRISRKATNLNHHQEQLRNISMDVMSQIIAANWITDTEIAVQIATSKWTSISDMLLRLEGNGFHVISLSSSVSSTASIFYSLHLQMRGECKVRLEELNHMIFGLSQSY